MVGWAVFVCCIRTLNRVYVCKIFAAREDGMLKRLTTLLIGLSVIGLLKKNKNKKLKNNQGDYVKKLSKI